MMRIASPTTILLLVVAAAAQAQSAPPAPMTTTVETTHDISMVDTAPLGGAISVPLPESQRRRLRKYDIPELVGSRQALGSQLIDGRLPKPILDYSAMQGQIRQRLSIFEGGLVVIDIRGAGGTISKKLILPDDALRNYLGAISGPTLQSIGKLDIVEPREGRGASLRLYDAPGHYIERSFDPASRLPKRLNDQIMPLQDLLRAIYEDREVTNTVAAYKPKPGDELVGDDRKVYRVERVIDDKIVVLRCLSQPTSIYVQMKDLYNYFIGTPGAASR